jgi:hypothetical protein
MANKIQFEYNRKSKNELKETFASDLNRLEYHVNELVQNIYASGKEDIFKNDIKKINDFFILWNRYNK